MLFVLLLIILLIYDTSLNHTSFLLRFGHNFTLIHVHVLLGIIISTITIGLLMIHLRIIINVIRLWWLLKVLVFIGIFRFGVEWLAINDI